MLEIQLYKNIAKCTACGGRCCKIYLGGSIGGYRDESVWFEEWCDGFHLHSIDYGVEPLFDPLVVHMTGNESMLQELIKKGIDPWCCQYLGENGCMISWDKRPLICRSWKCDLLDESDVAGVIELDMQETTPIPEDKIDKSKIEEC
jgi:hypothetical protein